MQTCHFMKVIWMANFSIFFFLKVESSQIGHSCKLCHFSKRHQHPLNSFESTILKKVKIKSDLPYQIAPMIQHLEENKYLDPIPTQGRMLLGSGII